MLRRLPHGDEIAICDPNFKDGLAPSLKQRGASLPAGLILVNDTKSQLNATITKRIDVSGGLVRFWVKPDIAYRPFWAGQYVALGLPAEDPSEPSTGHHDKLIKRTYSIASAPEQLEEIEFYLTVIPQGELTPRIAPLSPGDRIYAASKIAGTFTLERVPTDCHLIFVATGTGIAPYMSMLRSSSFWCQGRRVTLLHGVRHAEELAYRDELSELESKHSLQFVPVVSRGDALWCGIRGRVQQALFASDFALSPQCDHVFLCGNPQMVDQVEAELLNRGFQLHSKRRPGNLHLEKYW